MPDDIFGWIEEGLVSKSRKIKISQIEWVPLFYDPVYFNIIELATNFGNYLFFETIIFIQNKQKSKTWLSILEFRPIGYLKITPQIS